MKKYVSEFTEEKTKLQEVTFSVSSVDDAIGTISDCIQWIMIKKSMNPSISSELISRGIITGLDTLSNAINAPEEAVQQRATLTAKKILRNLTAFVMGKKTSEDF